MQKNVNDILIRLSLGKEKQFFSRLKTLLIFSPELLQSFYHDECNLQKKQEEKNENETKHKIGLLIQESKRKRANQI